MPPKDNSSSSGSSNSSSNQRSRHPTSYTLYVEHLGTLVPILEAQKRSSKIRQSFTISVPNSESSTTAAPQPQRMTLDTSETEAMADTSETSVTTNASQLRLSGHEAHLSLNTESGVQLACREDDSDSPRHPLNVQQASEVPQKTTVVSENSRHLAEVTSNVMASKFKIQSLSDKLSSDMGSILIKTSFLHIQPRKVITYLPHPELTDSGIDTDSSSDESSSEDSLPNGSTACAAEVFIEPDIGSRSIEGLMSMEELQLPKATELESKPLRAVSTAVGDRSSRSSMHLGTGSSSYSCTMSSSVKGQRISMSDSHIQIHSKTPTWNEQHMIYQLDFGGRVTTKSAKNFQLELENEQVRLSKYGMIIVCVTTVCDRYPLYSTLSCCHMIYR